MCESSNSDKALAYDSTDVLNPTLVPKLPYRGLVPKLPYRGLAARSPISPINPKQETLLLQPPPPNKKKIYTGKPRRVELRP